MFNRMIYENSRPDGVGILEIVPKGKPKEGAPPQFVPLKQSALSGEIAGPLATLRLTHVFGFTRQQSNTVIEAVYRFPLPGDAAVTDVQVRFGEVEIRALLKERQQAEADYETAKKKGQQAALATRESPDVFTLQVAGIHPDQDVTIETRYIQLARAEGMGWSLRIPLTTAPRYTRSDEQGSRHAQGQPLWPMRDPGHRFEMDVTVHGAQALHSPTHRLEVTGDNTKRVKLKDGTVIPDRDCVLTWQPANEDKRPTLQVMTYDDEVGGWVYFMALVMPPASTQQATQPREVILLVDRSGSMDGPKWAAAVWAVKSFIGELTPQDWFSLGLFDNVVEWAVDQPLIATESTTAAAVRFLEAHKPRGGTELGVALEQTLNLVRPTTTPSRHVLIVTDAQVSDDSRILRLASEENGRPDHRRISVLCIDAAPNSFLASELADRGGGVARFLTSDPAQEDITTALDEILADWAAPVLADLHLEVNQADVQAAKGQTLPGRATGWQGLDLGDLPMGRSVWAVGRVPRTAAASVTWRVSDVYGETIARLAAGQTQRLHAGEGLKALFGARRVLGLEYLINAGFSGQDLSDQLERLGYSAADVATEPGNRPRVYAETIRADAQKAVRGLLVREALAYGLASAETAFIAVRHEQGKPVEQTVAVANALPAGWSEDFVFNMAMPRSNMSRQVGGGGPSPRVMKAMTIDPIAWASPSGAIARPMPSAAMAESVPASPTRQMHTVFKGIPSLSQGEAILYDSSKPQPGITLPKSMMLSLLQVKFIETTPDAKTLAGLTLALYIDDMTTPRARVQLQDFLRANGERPLNLRVEAHQTLRLVLVDTRDAAAPPPPRMEIALG